MNEHLGGSDPGEVAPMEQPTPMVIGVNQLFLSHRAFSYPIHQSKYRHIGYGRERDMEAASNSDLPRINQDSPEPSFLNKRRDRKEKEVDENISSRDRTEKEINIRLQNSYGKAIRSRIKKK